MIDQNLIQPGHLLLYEASSLFGYGIALWSGSLISHIEMYKGGGISYASRDHQGVEEYPLRLDGLSLVLKSPVPLDMVRIAKGFEAKRGNAYDYSTIKKFATFGLAGGKPQAEVCSEIMAYLVRIGGLEGIFGKKQPDEVSPSDFVKAMEMGVLEVVWNRRA